MRSSRGPAEHGYTLAELLVVVTIVGVLSLISVPAFINYQRSNTLKAALRGFTHDIRAARQIAVTRNARIRIEFNAGNKTNTGYGFFQSTDNGTTWTVLTTGIVGAVNGRKKLDVPVYFSATTLTDVNANSIPDLVLKPDGTVSGGDVTIKTDWRLTYSQYTITVTNSGQISTVGA